MTNDWILDALSDMRTFAAMNDMPELAHQLDLTAEVAKRETRRLEQAPCRGGEEGIDRGFEARSGNSTSR